MAQAVVAMADWRDRNWVAIAVDRLGGTLRASQVADVWPATIARWMRAGKITQLRPAVKLSNASGVPVERFGGGRYV